MSWKKKECRQNFLYCNGHANFAQSLVFVNIEVYKRLFLGFTTVHIHIHCRLHSFRIGIVSNKECERGSETRVIKRLRSKCEERRDEKEEKMMDMDIESDATTESTSSSLYPPGDYEMGSVIQGDGIVNNLDFHR